MGSHTGDTHTSVMATCTALNAMELACQMDKLKVALRRKDKQLMAATEKVCEEFIDLKIPVCGEIEATLIDGRDPTSFYDAWSDKYEDDLVIVGNYTGYIKCAEAFLKLGLNHQVSILDLAAGTGLLGRELTSQGYTNIDGLDRSLGMLGQARKQQIYKNYIHASVEGLGTIPVNNDSYDVIVSSNGFAPGQIYPSAMPELLRVVRPGGYILIAMKDGYNTQSQRFAMMDTNIQALVRSKELELTIGPVIFKNFMLNNDGRFYMMRKPLSHHWAVGSPNSPHHSPLHSPQVARRNM